MLNFNFILEEGMCPDPLAACGLWPQVWFYITKFPHPSRKSCMKPWIHTINAFTHVFFSFILTASFSVSVRTITTHKSGKCKVKSSTSRANWSHWQSSESQAKPRKAVSDSCTWATVQHGAPKIRGNSVVVIWFWIELSYILNIRISELHCSYDFVLGLCLHSIDSSGLPGLTFWKFSSLLFIAINAQIIISLLLFSQIK